MLKLLSNLWSTPIDNKMIVFKFQSIDKPKTGYCRGDYRANTPSRLPLTAIMKQIKVCAKSLSVYKKITGGNYMSIYCEMLERVHNGDRFHIDFEKRTMRVGGELIINNGEYDTSKELYEGKIYNPQSLLSMIKTFYRNYKYSLPSERSDSKRRKYFKALSVEELTDEQMIVGENREVAQFELEAFILCTILSGDFVWDAELHGKWFYQCPLDPDLIILRSWVEGK